MDRSIPWTKLLLAILAGVVGYVVIVALTTLGFVGWLDGADLYRGGWILKAQGTLVAVIAGLAGGSVAGFIGRRRPVLHAVAVLPLIAVDTAYVLFVFPRTTPAWFELAGSLTLALSTVRRVGARLTTPYETPMAGPGGAAPWSGPRGAAGRPREDPPASPCRCAPHAAGFRARTNALRKRPSTCGAIASGSRPSASRKARASSAV